MTSGTTTVPLRRLDLEVQVDPEFPDRARLQVLVDGTNPFARVAPDWGGFDPNDLLGDDSVLLPRAPWRRVAVARCSCGYEGCGVIAALVVEHDGVVSWSDFRDWTGVFEGPQPSDSEAGDGRSWPIPVLRFAADQYRAEVARAAADRSWETRGRTTARLLRPFLEELVAAASQDMRVGWVAPAWQGDGVNVELRRTAASAGRTSWEYLHLPTVQLEPNQEAARLAALLAGSDPATWSETYGFTA